MTTAAPPVTPEAPTTGLSRTAGRRVVPLAGVRARGHRLEDPVVSWAAAIGIGLLALFLRLWRLGTPHAFEFDETYYAKDAWSLAHFGYVKEYVGGADDKILDGTVTGLWKDEPSMIVHPEVGKWLIALGEMAFGMDPFGWRFSAAVAGALMVVVMVRLGRRLTGSTLLGCVAGLLLSLDGLHLVLSRLALLDIFVALFLLCGISCLVNDRAWHRARMGRLLPAGRVPSGSWGPVRGLLLRPWLLAGGVSFGLGLGTKWAVAYPLAVFGVLVWLWSAGARRSFGVRWSVLRSAVVDGVPAFLQLIGVALVVYVASWTGWLLHAQEYETHLSATQYTHAAGGRDWPTRDEPDAEGLGEVTQSLRSLASYHRDAYVFHTRFLDGKSHTYASSPSGWLLLSRPVGVAADTDIQPGQRGCDAPAGSTCLRQVLLLGNPVIWWGGVAALLVAAVLWIGARDWRFGLTVIGTAATWLPWLMYDDRPIFSFYAILTLPFLVLALTLGLGKVLGSSRAPAARRTTGVVVAGAYFVLALVGFAWFWPVWTDGLLTHGEWLDRIWFSRWI